MGQSAEELRQEIERSRDDLSGDLEAIGDRVSPRRMIQRRTGRMRDFWSGTRDRIFGRAADVRSGTTDLAHQAGDAVRDVPDRATERVEGNPLAAGAVAFGVGFLAAVVFPGTQTEAQAAARLAEPLQPVAEELTAGVKEAASQVASTAQEAGQDAVAELKESATDKAAKVKETAQDEKDTIQSQA